MSAENCEFLRGLRVLNSLRQIHVLLLAPGGNRSINEGLHQCQAPELGFPGNHWLVKAHIVCAAAKIAGKAVS